MTTIQSSEQNQSSGKGKAFFDRGDQVAETGNWDFAIQMYLEGIRREPFNLERGHQPLREAALKRKLAGGKPAGMFDGKKFKDNPNDGLANAEHLLSKDPGNTSHMLAVLKEMRGIEAPAPAVKWILDLLSKTMQEAKKPDKRVLTQLIETYAAIEEFAGGLAACDLARRHYPDDPGFEQASMKLSGLQTIKAGKYEKDGKFTDSVKDLNQQLRLNQQDHMMQGRGFLESEIERARKDYEASPTVAGKIEALANALSKIEEDGYENEAMDVLRAAYTQTKAYRYKQKVDDIKVKQLRRRYTQLRAQGQNEAAMTLAREQLAFEMAMYAERAANYPTDLSIKYELGRRQLAAGKIDDAIASLQQAQREPKRRVRALNYLGLAFFKKEWHREAAETFAKALEHEPGEEQAKELHYNLALALKAMGETKQALEHLSTLAQMDYNYKDVKQLVDELRKEQK